MKISHQIIHHSLLAAAFFINLEAATGFEPAHQGFADPCLTTWLCRRVFLNVLRFALMKNEQYK